MQWYGKTYDVFKTEMSHRCFNETGTKPQGRKTIFMLNSADHETNPANKLLNVNDY